MAGIIFRPRIIIRRHDTSIRNLLNNLHLVDHLIVVDNSSAEGDIVLQSSRGWITHRVNLIPNWVEQIEKQYLK